MSKVALSGNASGTGTFTIASPNSNTDRTLTLPDATGTVVTANGSNQLVAPASGILFADATTQTTAATAPTTATVLAATAGASFDAVGTYALASRAGLTTGDVSAGGTLAGSQLRRQSAVVGIIEVSNSMPYGAALSGTWRAMSNYTYNNGLLAGIALWLRIS